jgi:hypothetical protein
VAARIVDFAVPGTLRITSPGDSRSLAACPTKLSGEPDAELTGCASEICSNNGEALNPIVNQRHANGEDRLKQ